MTGVARRRGLLALAAGALVLGGCSARASGWDGAEVAPPPHDALHQGVHPGAAQVERQLDPPGRTDRGGPHPANRPGGAPLQEVGGIRVGQTSPRARAASRVYPPGRASR